MKNQLYSPTDTDWWLFSSFPPLNFTYIEFFLLTFVVQSFSCDLVATLKVLTWLDSGFRKMLMRVESCRHLLNLSLNLTFKCLLYFLSFPLFLILSVSYTILLWFVSLLIFHIPPLSAPEILRIGLFYLFPFLTFPSPTISVLQLETASSSVLVSVFLLYFHYNIYIRVLLKCHFSLIFFVISSLNKIFVF